MGLCSPLSKVIEENPEIAVCFENYSLFCFGDLSEQGSNPILHLLGVVNQVMGVEENIDFFVITKRRIRIHAAGEQLRRNGASPSGISKWGMNQRWMKLGEPARKQCLDSVDTAEQAR